MASTDAPQPAKGPLEATCAAALDEWRSAGLERRPASFSSAQDPVSVVDGERLVNFASANYLGLATHPRVVEAAAAAARRLGAGSGGSRLTAGTTDLHLELEAELASWLGYPDAVLFGSGFSANVGLLGALGEKGRLVCSDAANHASIIDGARAARQAGAGLAVYPHLDATAAEEALAAAPDALGIVVTDGLFSMSGDLAPIAKLSRAARRRGAALVVDDAHGIGVLGAAGRGAFEEAGAERPDVLVGALSKALGGEAGFVCASKEVCELLRQKARTYVFSTALAAPAVAAGLAAVRLAAGEPERRGRLARLTDRLRGGLKEAGIPALPGTGPIVAVPTPGAGVAVTAARRLRGAGLFAPRSGIPPCPAAGRSCASRSWRPTPRSTSTASSRSSPGRWPPPPGPRKRDAPQRPTARRAGAARPRPGAASGAIDSIPVVTTADASSTGPGLPPTTTKGPTAMARTTTLLGALALAGALLAAGGCAGDADDRPENDTTSSSAAASATTTRSNERPAEKPDRERDEPEEAAPEGEPAGSSPAEPGSAPDLAISSCGDPSIHERGTTFFADGTSGWTQFCQDQMSGIAGGAPSSFDVSHCLPAGEATQWRNTVFTDGSSGFTQGCATPAPSVHCPASGAWVRPGEACPPVSRDEVSPWVRGQLEWAECLEAGNPVEVCRER